MDEPACYICPVHGPYGPIGELRCPKCFEDKTTVPSEFHMNLAMQNGTEEIEKRLREIEELKARIIRGQEEMSKPHIIVKDPWIHRSKNMSCKTCMWFTPKTRAPGPRRHDDTGPETYDLGRCRRHAPTMSGYPAVFVNDWCGDHKIDENKI